jgi:hypothetical protein
LVGLEDVNSQVGDLQVETKKGAGKQQQFKNKLGDVAEYEETIKLSAVSSEVGSKLQHSAIEASNDIVEEIAAKSREGDLRAELSRRRAERLTKVSVYIGFLRGSWAICCFKSFTFLLCRVALAVVT